MQISEFTQKVEIIRRYQAAIQKAPMKLMGGANMPLRVELGFDGETHTFTLEGKEQVKLLSEFNVNSLDDLFLV